MRIKEEVDELKKEVKAVKEQSDYIRILKMSEDKNKRLCWIIVLLIILLATSLCYIAYLYSDIGTKVITEETETYDMDAENGVNNVIGGDNNGTNEIYKN